MENNRKIERIDRKNIDTTPKNKKVVRKVVKVINKDDLKNINIEEEIRIQKTIKEQENLKKQLNELKKKEELQKKLLEEKRIKNELERKEREKERLKIEAEKKENLLRQQKEKELIRKKQEEIRIKKEIELQKKKEEDKRKALLIKQQKEEEKKKNLALAKEQKEKTKKLKKENKEKEKIQNKEFHKKEKEYFKNEKLSKKIFRIFKIAFISSAITGFSGIIVLFLILYSWCKDIPELNVNQLSQYAKTSYVYDTNGDLITAYSSGENRDWVSLEEMPTDLVEAFVSVEDKRFYEHGPVDLKRLIGAILGQLTSGDDYGGSTITQQLVKNAFLSNEVTYKRKTQEIVLSYKLEKIMSKDDILEAYLNIIYFGSSNYGVSAAAKDYFDKDLDELTLREIAMLAGLPKNPNGYNPRRNTYVKNDMSATNKRTDTVLYVMHNNGLINDTQYEMALNDTVKIKEESSFFSMYDNAHAVEYVMTDVVDDMIEHLELENNYTNRIEIERKIRQGGYAIYSTIDTDIQNIVQDSLENWENYPSVLNSEGKEIIDENGNKEKPQATTVVINPSNGHILAMIGSRENPTSMKTFNRAIENKMPIASTIKPISIYAPCLEKGLSPGSIEYNFKTYIDGYDISSAFPGGVSPESAVTMREAVNKSYNVSAARFLCNNIGYDLAEDYLIKLGINKNSIQKNGSGLALGTSGINVLELTAAYQTFANGGWYIEPKSYTKVIDSDGNIILNASDYQIKRQVFSEDTAWLMTDILKDAIPLKDKNNVLKNIDTAGKTGTHQEKCAVFSGYTKEYVSSIWIGSDSFSDLSDSSGAKQAIPLWQDYMSKIYEKKQIEKELIYDSKPMSIQEVDLCDISGMIATEKCSSSHKDFISSNSTIKGCTIHREIATCAYSGMLIGDSCPEHAIRKNIGLFAPVGSNIASLPAEILQKYYPGIMVESIDNKCISHINGIPIPSEAQIGYTKSLLSTINSLRTNTLINQDQINMLNTDYAVLESYILRAENALYNGNQETETFYTEFFDNYNRIKGNCQNIQAIIANSTVVTEQ